MTDGDYGDRMEYDGDEEQYPAALWFGALRQALKSQRGRAYLTDLKAALEALPERRLIRGRVATYNEDSGEGEVCAVGALALWQRTHGLGAPGVTRKRHWTPKRQSAPVESRESVLEDLATTAPGADDGAFEMAWFGQSLGMTYVLAWDLAQMNDQLSGDPTPEQRWQAVHDWVVGQLENPDEHRRAVVRS